MPVGSFDWNWCSKKGKTTQETSKTQWTWIQAGRRRQKGLKGNDTVKEVKIVKILTSLDTVFVYPKPALKVSMVKS